MSTTLEIRLGGEVGGKPVSPTTFPVADLLRFLEKFLEAVKAESGPDLLDLRAPGTISLAEIKSGSTKLVFEMGTATPAANRITSALAVGDLSSLRYEAQQAIRSALNGVINRGGEVQLANGRETPVFSRANPLPLARKPAVVKEFTSLLAFVNEVGHESKPTARVRLYTAKTPIGNDELTVHLSRSLCIELGQCIFRDVTLEGVASWITTETPWRLAGFTVTKFTPMAGEAKAGGRPLVEIFADMASAAPGAWDDIDPADYVTEARSKDEEES